MRRLALTATLSVLFLCGIAIPGIAHADISQPTADTETTDPFVDSGGWYQNLGTGISGTLTEADFVIDWQSVSGLGDRMGIEIDACTDSTYTTCPSSTTFNLSYTASNGVHTIVFNPTTLGFPINYVFSSDKYYRITVERIFGPNFNADRTFRVLGSAADTYAYGSTSAGGLSDLAFTLVGVSRPSTSGGLPQIITTGDKPSVLFLPGIEGSRLYDGDGNKVWEPSVPGTHGDISELYMDANGHSIRPDIYAKEDDLITSDPFAGDTYGKMLADFEQMKQDGELADWKAISYDWRLPIDEILKNGHDVDGKIYYDGPNAETNEPYIISELRRLAANGGKVTIVAHSNGGLIAKRLTEILGPEESTRLIDKIILVASPQAGTPDAIYVALHGDIQNGIEQLAVSKPLVRTFGSTTPMSYNLMPSYNYFTQVDDPVVSFDARLTDWIKRYGATIHSRETLDAFLRDSYGRVDSRTTYTGNPIQLDPSGVLTGQANALHDDLDNWTPPAGIQVVQIAGWGITKTVAGVTYIPGFRGKIEATPDTVVDGDGTVVVPSALWTSGPNVNNYWLNLHQYNLDKKRSLSLQNIFPTEHGTIFSISALRDFVRDLVQHTPQDISSYAYLSTMPPPSNGKRLRYSLRSPLTLDFYDSLGRHTGVSTTTGAIEEQIPGIYYGEVGDVRYAVADENIPVHIVMKGYDEGTFTFEVEQLEGNKVAASTAFSDIPVATSTTAVLDTNGTLASVSQMKLDEDGDGVYESILNPVTPDQLPEASIQFDAFGRYFTIGQTGTSSRTSILSENNGTKSVNDGSHSLGLQYSLQKGINEESLSVSKLTYDSIATSTSAELSFYWDGPTGGRPNAFLMHFETASTSVLGFYIQALDRTYVVSSMKGKQVLNLHEGLIIPQVITSKGKLEIN